jgi:hypothetical protein
LALDRLSLLLEKRLTRWQAKQRSAINHRGKAVTIQLAVLVVLLGGWESLVQLKVISPFALAAPSTIGGQVWKWTIDGELWNSIQVTLTTVAVGYTADTLMGKMSSFVDTFECPSLSRPGQRPPRLGHRLATSRPAAGRVLGYPSTYPRRRVPTKHLLRPHDEPRTCPAVMDRGRGLLSDIR